MDKKLNVFKSEKLWDKIGEVGIYVYTINLMISKGKINLGLGLMALGFLIKLYKREKIKLLKEEQIILLILILTPIFSLLSPGGFDSFKIALEKNYRYLGIFLIPIFLKNKTILKRTVFLIFTSFSINFLNALSIFKRNGFNPPYTRYVSFGGNTLNESHMNAMLIMLSFSVCVYVIKNKSIIYKILNIVLFGLISWALILGQGRGAWLGSIVAFITVSFFMAVNKKKYFVGLFLILMLGIGSLKIPIVQNSPFVKRFTSIKETNSDMSNKIRILMWKGSIDMFKKHPIFGVGRDNSPKYFLEFFEKENKYEELPYESTRNSLKEIAEAGNAHNMYFTSLGEQGILVLGFIGMFMYMFYSEVSFLLKKKRYTFTYCIILGTIGMLVAFCVGGLTENNWQEFWKSSMVCTSMGIYLAIKKMELKNKNNENLSMEKK